MHKVQALMQKSPCHAAGSSDMETQQLIYGILEDGSGEVLALPDGPVCGRWDLSTLAGRAKTKGAEKITNIVGAALSSARSKIGGNGASASSGIKRDLCGSDEGMDMIKDLEVKVSGLESKIWDALDAVAALRMRVRQTRLALPLGLLQLRPPPSPISGSPTVAPGLSWDSGLGVGLPNGGISQPAVVRGLASDGLDTCAASSWPVLRRADRLTWALAATMIDAANSEQRYKFLACNSLEMRLGSALTIIQDMHNVLSVLAGINRTR